LRTFALPGGEAAVREPRRSAIGLLYEIYGEAAFDMDVPSLRAFSNAEITPLRTMLQRNLNSPRTSSAGRLFDAVASLAGIRQKTCYEGQAAMELEFATGDAGTNDAYPFQFADALLDWEPMTRAIVADVKAGATAAAISAKFHLTMSEMIATVAAASNEPQVVLTGGCFQNERLLRLAVTRLREAGLRPIWHQRIPPNDGGIALGQIAAAWRR
jgi:hydrogenase maturation protein HypF